MTAHPLWPEWKYPPGMAPEWVHDWHLHAMCDHGAKQFALGKCAGLLLRIMPCEVQKVRAYMAEKHPAVPYRMKWPDWSALVPTGSPSDEAR